MIDLLKAPREGSYILDGNDTFIEAQLSSPDSYIEAVITVANETLYTQVWSVDNDGKTVQNMRYLLRASFSVPFTPIEDYGISTVVRSKNVVITLRERAKRTRSIITEIILPSFNVLPSQNPVAFDFDQELVLLRDSAAPINVRPDKGLRIPFYANYQAPVTIAITNELGDTIYNQTLNSEGTYNGAIPAQSFNYLDLPSTAQDAAGVMSLIGFNAFFTITITVGSTSITQECYYHRNSVYGYKELYYQNNFLVYEQGILYGMVQEGLRLNPQSYRDQEDQDITYEIPVDKQVAVNSGYVFQEQNSLVATIAQSIDVRLRENETYYRYLAASKKLDVFESLKRGYDHELTFTRNFITAVENEGSTNATVFLNNATFTVPYNTAIEVLKSEITPYVVASAPIEQIRFIQPPTEGSLVSTVVFPTLTSNVNMFIYNYTNPEGWMHQYPYDDYIRLRYNAQTGSTAAISDSVGVQVQAGGIWSNVAIFTFNIQDVNGNDFGPSVDAGATAAFIDDNGAASTALVPAYSDGANNDSSFLWQVEQGSGTFDDVTLENPTYTQVNSNNGDVDVLSVKVTDNVNKKTSTNFIEVLAVRYALDLAIVKDTTASTATNHVYDVTITGGAPGETVDVKHVLRASDLSQYARVDTAAPPADIITLSLAQAIKTPQYTFTDNGNPAPVTRAYKIVVVDTEQLGGIELAITLTAASGTQEIIATTQAITI